MAARLVRLVYLLKYKKKRLVFNFRRNSYDQFRETYDDDDAGTSYSCNCGQEYITEEQLRRHQVCYDELFKMVMISFLFFFL